MWPLVDQDLDPGNLRLLTLSPVQGKYTLPTMGTTFKDTVLREQCVFETIGMVCETEPC